MKKRLKLIIKSSILIIAILIVSFYIYTADYYKADEFAVQTTKSTEIKINGDLTILSPTTASQKGIIFYPGAKVEESSYLPLLEKLRRKGITCVVVKMPFHLAIFNKDGANDVLEKIPEMKQWYMAGHSLGGAMASSYASKHKDRIDGLILLGAYVYGDFPIAKTVTIYGSEDTILNKSKIKYNENIFVIPGGNHAQFGNYGYQKGDGKAAITADEQQEKTVDIILKFINK